MASAIRRVIVDVDVGTDDYLALLILLKAQERGQIRIEAIVCSMGNTTVDNVCKNLIRLLEIVGRTDIPVFRGASRQLISPENEIKVYHGQDGFGELQHSTTPDISIIRDEPAAVGIANLVLNNPDDVTLICVAPLTNIALAIRLYDNFADSIKDMWIMGGNYTAKGNTTATAEYNFYIDPEAVHIVLDSVKKPVYIVTWETCLHPKITFVKEWRYNVFGLKTDPAIQLLNRAEKSVYGENEKIWLPCDAFLAAAFVHPETVITRTSSHNASIELHGSQTRGQIVLDHLKVKRENVTIIEEINSELFQQLLLQL